MMVDNLTLEEVIYADNQFSPAYMISYSELTETSLNEDYDDAFEAIKKKFLNLQKKCDKLNGK